ncbi:hypothetical protein [Thermocrispum agreste]|uniref:hypothetical protein n=1 Tax=Thermocrispum agreste TaxID=37925 RepID=UPI0003F98910|nr:hypothetical protein [Thermocrispum agreste]
MSAAEIEDWVDETTIEFGKLACEWLEEGLLLGDVAARYEESFRDEGAMSVVTGGRCVLPENVC